VVIRIALDSASGILKILTGVFSSIEQLDRPADGQWIGPFKTQPQGVTGFKTQTGIDVGICLIFMVEQIGIGGELAPGKSAVGRIEEVVTDFTAVELLGYTIDLGEIGVIKQQIRDTAVGCGKAVKGLIILAPTDTADKTLVVVIDALATKAEIQF